MLLTCMAAAFFTPGAPALGAPPTATPTPSGEPGPPVLGALTELTEGVLQMEWANYNSPPDWHLALAYDLLEQDWVRHPDLDYIIWWRYPSDATSGTLGLQWSGGYFLWIGNAYAADRTYFPCMNPDAFIIYWKEPHVPVDTVAVDLGGGVIDVTWRPDIYGTWIYWLVAWDVAQDAPVESLGPVGDATRTVVWHFVGYGDADFMNGHTTLTLPDEGAYWVLMWQVSWDAVSWSKTGGAYVGVGP